MPIAKKVFEQFVIDGVACQETKGDRITVGIGRPKAEQVRGRIHRGATPPEDARAAAHRILAAAGMGASASSSAGEPSSSMKDSEAAQARAAAAMRYDLFGDSESSSIKHLLDGVDALVERKRNQTDFYSSNEQLRDRGSGERRRPGQRVDGCKDPQCIEDRQELGAARVALAEKRLELARLRAALREAADGLAAGDGKLDLAAQSFQVALMEILDGVGVSGGDDGDDDDGDIDDVEPAARPEAAAGAGGGGGGGEQQQQGGAAGVDAAGMRRCRTARAATGCRRSRA